MFWKGLFTVLQFIINIFGNLLSFLLSVFPPSPFHLVSNSAYADFLAQINFFIPFYELIVIMEAWLVAIGIFYLYSVIARWVKAIE